MKKISLFAIFLASWFSAALLAQPTIVSTQPTNKNVILEEYTGMHCPYCPDGHRIANQLMQTYPNRVFSILIHQGIYAVPGSGEPDYRTPFCDALAGQTGLTGYPAGTVNRHVFTNPAPMTAGGTAQSRANWQNCATQIMAMPSPVNIAIDLNLDYQTRQLSILVEVYYTDTASNSTNKLNVALLQDYVKGPQAGSSLNPSQIAPDGQYYHMHMLRTLLTGQWGITIPQTTAGTFWDTTLVYTVPTNFNNVPVDLGNLKVVAFVAEGNQEILTGVGKTVPVSLDASVFAISNVSEFSCENQITPSIKIRNEGLDTIISYDIEYGVKNGVSDTLHFDDTLVPGANKLINLTALNALNGYNVVYATIFNTNGQADNRSFNNTYQISVTKFYNQINPPYSQDFASTTFPPTNMSIQDISKDGQCWMRSTAHSGSAKIPFFSIEAGNEDALYIAPLDLSSLQNPALKFKVAHKMYNSSYIDKLYVQVSTDCGTSWATKWFKQDPDLATSASSQNQYTSPSTSDWRDEYVDLTSYAGQQNVIIRFNAVSGYGNNLFLDDINIVESTALSDDVKFDLMLYPNPANEDVHLLLNQTPFEPMTLQVFNTEGKLVFNDKLSSSSYVLPVQSMNDGLYYIVLKSSNEVIKRPLVIQR